MVCIGPFMFIFYIFILHKILLIYKRKLTVNIGTVNCWLPNCYQCSGNPLVELCFNANPFKVMLIYTSVYKFISSTNSLSPIKG